MSGHGHVVPNADGSRTRCGGPGICAVCNIEAAADWRRLRRDNDALRALITDFAAAFDSPCPNMQQWAHIKAKAREVRAALAEGRRHE